MGSSASQIDSKLRLLNYSSLQVFLTKDKNDKNDKNNKIDRDRIKYFIGLESFKMDFPCERQCLDVYVNDFSTKRAPFFCTPF